VFRLSFGLDALPESPGMILLRGARQYGKSTWLEQQIAATTRRFGPGTAFYLNGDEIAEANGLTEAIRELVPLFRRGAPVRRRFIDEITAIRDGSAHSSTWWIVAYSRRFWSSPRAPKRTCAMGPNGCPAARGAWIDRRICSRRLATRNSVGYAAMTWDRAR
jgi:hypothetical protein